MWESNMRIYSHSSCQNLGRTEPLSFFPSFLPSILPGISFSQNHATAASVKNWHVLQSQGPIMITVSRCGGGARGNVMLGRRAEGKSRVAGSCPLCYVDVCGPWVMARRVSALPSTCKHTHPLTHTCLSVLAAAQGMPTHQPAG